MASQTPGKGTVIQLSISSVFTTVAQVIDITPPNAKVETYKSTDLSTGVGHTYNPTGYVEGGETTFEVWYDPQTATHKALLALITTPPATPSSWKVIYADSANSVWAFSGILESFDPKVVMTEGVKATIKIKVSGTITFPS